MVKKSVPDWLNSPLWYSPLDPSTDDRRYCSKSSYADDEDSTVRQAPPQPPPIAVVRSEPPNSKSQSPKSDFRDDANGASTSYALTADDITRQAQLLVEISKKTVDMREVRRLASMGIPDGAGIRAIVWKLLLGYLPNDRSSWPSELSKKRSQYNRFKEELLMSPSVRNYEEVGEEWKP